MFQNPKSHNVIINFCFSLIFIVMTKIYEQSDFRRKKVLLIFINFINFTIIDYSLSLQESQGRDFK